MFDEVKQSILFVGQLFVQYPGQKPGEGLSDLRAGKTQVHQIPSVHRQVFQRQASVFSYDSEILNRQTSGAKMSGIRSPPK